MSPVLLDLATLTMGLARPPHAVLACGHVGAAAANPALGGSQTRRWLVRP